MTATPQLLTGDHIDLLITAALRWRIFTDRTTAAFTLAENHLVVATATEAARIVQQKNLAALRWLSDRGRSRLADRAVPDPHVFSEVDVLDPVEVIKACHAAQHLCSPAPGWAGSTAHRLLAAISTAATHRLPGYAEAPWIWTRPHVRAGRPSRWVRGGGPTCPVSAGCRWPSSSRFGSRRPWSSSPPKRRLTWVVAGEEEQARAGRQPNEVWDAVAAASPEAVLQ